MKNMGIVLLLIGVFVFINSNNFAGVFRGKYTLSFLNPKSPVPSTVAVANPITGGTLQHPVNSSGGGV